MQSRGAGLWLAALALLSLPGPGLGRRGEALVGGLRDVPVSDTGVEEAARFAVAAYNKGSNGLHYYRAGRVLEARSQVVAGVKYYLTMELEKTQCRKNGVGLEDVDISKCPLPAASEQLKLHCEFQVLSRLWLNEIQLLSQNCSDSSS